MTLLLAAVLLGGCWSRVEVNDLVVVYGMAVDRTPDGWRIVVQAANAGLIRAGAQETGARQGEATLVEAAAGATVAEAAYNLQRSTSRRIYLGHMRVLLLGEEVARQGLAPVLDFFERFRQTRPTIRLLVTRGPAGPLLAEMHPLVEPVASEAVRELLRYRMVPDVSMALFLAILSLEGQDPVLPVLALAEPDPQPSGQNGLRRPLMAGTALFRGDRLVGWLDPALTEALLWVRGDTRRQVMSIPAPGVPGTVAVELFTVTTRCQVAPAAPGRVPRIHLAVRADGALVESMAPLDLNRPETLARVENAVRAEMEDRLRRLFAAAAGLRVDPLGFGEMVHRARPDLWRQIRDRWRAAAQEVPITLDVQVSLERTGFVAAPETVTGKE